MEVKQCDVCLAMNSAYNLICGNCGERLNNTKEKGLSSFENCEVDVLTVYPNQQNGQPGSAIYKNAIVKFIDDFVMINDKMLVPKNNILGIEEIENLFIEEINECD